LFGSFLQRETTGCATLAARPRCEVCRCPVRACWCKDLQPVETAIEFVILQHPFEARRTVSTGRMACLGVRGAKIFTGLDFTGDRRVNEIIADPDRSVWLLSPGADAVDLASLFHRNDSAVPDVTSEPAGRRTTLIILDGTWAQARRMRRLSVNLHPLRRVALAPAQPSEFAVRRQPEAHCLSTLETIVHCLRVLDGPDPERDRQLMRPMRNMVARQIEIARIAKLEAETGPTCS